MRRILSLTAMLATTLLVSSCTKVATRDGATAPTAYTGSSSVSSGGSNGGGGGGTAGVMTAGEWNDLSHWDFWTHLMNNDTIKNITTDWSFYLQNKITVTLKDNAGKPLADAELTALCNGVTASARTSNDGNAVLFLSPFQPGFNLTDYSLSAKYLGQSFNLGTHPPGETTLEKTLPVLRQPGNTLDIMFVVDATGSMADEIYYLKNELKDVITRAGGQLPGRQIRMGSVFYRDNGDEYLTRVFQFSTNPDALNDFVNQQNAGGGGDYPEAVDEALKVAIQDQHWSADAVNRLLFLVLDAPPHNTPVVLEKLKSAITTAQRLGIRIIPISASGIDLNTEFLLRLFSISTNSTYVFITDDSGIGNPHHHATVGDYAVEYLNNLMVRLISQYGQNNN